MGASEKIWRFFRASCRSSETVPSRRVKNSRNCKSGSRRTTKPYAPFSPSGLDAMFQAMIWMLRSRSCPQTNLGQSFAQTLLDRARREHMTFRDLYNVAAAARGHWAVCGTATQVADILEEWFVAGAADGFMILPAHFPRSLEIFVERVVPELQRRGLFRHDYSGTTLRDHLGLSRPSSKAGRPLPQSMTG